MGTHALWEEEGRRGEFARYQIGYYIGDCSKNAHSNSLSVLQLGENLEEGRRERFWFLWPQRELGVNHAPFEIAVPHPRSISACWFLLLLDEPTPSMHANSKAALITDYSSCRTNSEGQFLPYRLRELLSERTNELEEIPGINLVLDDVDNQSTQYLVQLGRERTNQHPTDKPPN